MLPHREETPEQMKCLYIVSLSIFLALFCAQNNVHAQTIENYDALRRKSQTRLLTPEEETAANIKAVINIVANFTEIIGATMGGPAAGAGVALLFVPDRRKIAPFMLLGGGVVALIGLAAPGLGMWIVDINNL
jgi:hypothetical protein